MENNAVERDTTPGVLRHLECLTNSFTRRGHRIYYINIYARPLGSRNAPQLELITARESGFEGIACVDDVARAAILALQVYEQSGSSVALRLANEWLSFVAYMQEPDGRFTNFIRDETGAKNRHGRTSRVGGRWWTVRAMYALATAWRITGDQRILRRFKRGRLTPTSDMKVKALQALALMEIYRVEPDDALQMRILRLCDAIVGSGPRYFRDKAQQKHVALWGYHQLQAVARAGHLFSRLDYIAACESTVTHLVKPAIEAGFYHVFPSVRDHQCAYDISTLTVGLEELYRVTHRSAYRDLALQAASWLDGNNPSGTVVYNRRTGRCSDGFKDDIASLNCGAESTIEAGFAELARSRLRRELPRRQAGSAK